MGFLLPLFFGISFGYILQRVGAFEYENIINTLRLKDFAILKFLLLSMAASTIGVFFLRALGLLSLDLISANPILNIAGGIVFGVGFALAGYCPGTCIGAAGEGKKDARYTIFGGLMGVLAYTFLNTFTGIFSNSYSWGEISLVDLSPVNSISTALIFSSLIFGVLFFIVSLEQKRLNTNI